MADNEIRIKDLTESADLASGDNFVIDNANSRGTKRFPYSEFKKLTPLIFNNWTPLTTYQKDAFVTYEGKLYHNKTDSSVNAQTWQGSSVWEEVVLDDYLLNIVKNFVPLYSGGTTYKVSDYVVRGYKLYRCKTDGATGEWDSSKWVETNIISYIKNIVLSNFSAKRITSGVSESVSKGEIYIIKDYMYKAIVDTQTSPLDMDDWEEVTVESLIADIDETIDEALETKADKSGVYGDIVSGNVKSNSYEVDTAPYLYRPSKDGSAVEEEIVGGTVAWNQLAPIKSSDASTTIDGITITDNRDGSYSVSGTASATVTFKIVEKTWATHKYYFGGCPSGGSASTYSVRMYGQGTDSVEIGNGKIWDATNNTWKGLVIYVSSGASISTPIKFRPHIIDLTQAFGSTIADTVYTKEQAESGSGIAWLKSYGFLTKDYYAYDSGSLQSVNVASRKVVGFNQWDEEWELGTYDNTTGAKVNASNRIRSKNYIKCVPNTNYYAKLWQGATYSIRMFYYDANYNFISSPDFIQQGVFTTPNNAYYMTLILATTYGTTYNNDICINISDTSKNGTYEPYTSTTYTFDSSKIIRGIPKLSNGQMYYDGDVMTSDGNVKRKFGIVDLGSYTYTAVSMSNDRTAYCISIYDLPMNPKYDISSVPNAVCPKFLPTYQTASAWMVGDFVFTGSAGTLPQNSLGFITKTSDYADATTFKQAMNGVYLVYELATPTTESATPFENPQLVFSGGTEEFVDGATRDVAIPVGQNSKYAWDIKGKVEQLYGIPEVPSANGNYRLKATRSASGVVYSWESIT